jgi:hypothetical protein
MYKRLNEAKVQQCTRQNIAADRKAEFGSLGVASPLFRYVTALNYGIIHPVTSRFADMRYERWDSSPNISILYKFHILETVRNGHKLYLTN